MSSKRETERRKVRLNSAILRRNQMTTQERKEEDLMKLYGVIRHHIGRTPERVWPCHKRRCKGKRRRPCVLLQYLEECTTCGTRYGDSHNSEESLLN